MLIVSHGYYSLTYLFSCVLISRRYRVPTQSVVNKALTPSLIFAYRHDFASQP